MYGLPVAYASFYSGYLCTFYDVSLINTLNNGLREPVLNNNQNNGLPEMVNNTQNNGLSEPVLNNSPEQIFDSAALLNR